MGTQLVMTRMELKERAGGTLERMTFSAIARVHDPLQPRL